MGILDKIIGIGKDDKKSAAAKKVDAEDKKEKKERKDVKSEEKKEVKTEKKKTGEISKKKVKKIDIEKIPTHYFEIVRKPHISEKALKSVKENKYVFQVSASANKTEIKKAIEKLYGVPVKSVNLVNIPGKPKRFKGILGFKSGYKKAIVTLEKGSTMDVMEGA